MELPTPIYVSLPVEILQLIFDLLPLNHLASCALVNREWFRIASAMVWQRPFEFDYIHQKCCTVKTYLLSFTNEQENELLVTCRIKLPASKFSGIRYPLYLKHLDVGAMVASIRKWLEWVRNTPKGSETRPFYLGDSEMDDAYRAVTVMRLLCKMLVGLGVSLSGLKIGGTQDDITMSAYEFYAVTAHIQDLVVECNSEVGWHHFIEYRYWRNLRSLKVTVSSPEHIEDIAKFLIAQRSLETFKFTSNNITVDPQRILRALDKQGNSLKYLTIKNTSLSKCMPLYTVAGLKRLQSLRFENVSGVNATIIRPLLNAKFPYMKRVCISGDETVCSEAHIWAQSFK